MAGNTFGSIFKLTTFGESHGAGIGGVIDGCPAGLKIDLAHIQIELDRRKPGQSDLTTSRTESDTIEFLSGIFEGVTLGTPIAFVVRNEDQRSQDYSDLKDVFRPGHADFTTQNKFGIRDYRGGGRSSARETLARVAGGAIAKQLLNQMGVSIHAFVSSVHQVVVPLPYTQLDLVTTYESLVRCPHAETEVKMIQRIQEAKEDKDSVGGIITCVIQGAAVGWGEPVFDKLHALLGHAMLSINAVKGFEIGDGFSSTLRKGSENNDTINSNHDGGIQGGISNGKDIVLRIAFKPTSTIGKRQEALNSNGETVQLEASGRHDPCVLPRAVAIVEAMAALVIADAALLARTNKI
jgi:chorismate synthase